MSDTIHRDCFNAVMAQFNRLNVRQPLLATDIKMRLAKDYVRTLALADTAIMRLALAGRGNL